MCGQGNGLGQSLRGLSEQAGRSVRTLARLRRRWQSWTAQELDGLIAAITELQPGARVVPEGVVTYPNEVARFVSWSQYWEEISATQTDQPRAGFLGSVNLKWQGCPCWV